VCVLCAVQAYDSMQNDYNRFFARCRKIAVGVSTCSEKNFSVLKVQKMSGLSYPQSTKMRDLGFLSGSCEYCCV
jgi:hypothetical protein